MPSTSLRKLGLQLLAVLLVLNLLAGLWALRNLRDLRDRYEDKAEATTQNLALVLDQGISNSVEKIDTWPCKAWSTILKASGARRPGSTRRGPPPCSTPTSSGWRA